MFGHLAIKFTLSTLMIMICGVIHEICLFSLSRVILLGWSTAFFFRKIGCVDPH